MSNTKMALFLLFTVTMMLVAGASSSSSLARFQSVPAFHSKSNASTKTLPVILSSRDRHQTDIFAIRGGAEDGDDKDAKEEEEDAADDADDAVDTDGEASDGEDETESDSSDESSDDEEYYDDETDEEEESESDSQVAKQSAEKASEFVDPLFISPSLQMYVTFGTILLSRKIDMFNPKVVRLARLFFVLYLLAQQAFIFYVRIMAKRNNDRTPVDVQNPLGNMISNQLGKQPVGANDMVKNLASNFLKSESTVMEYDMGKARNMQGGMFFNMAFMWFLHFKLQQVQPLVVSTASGIMQLVYNPLFQVYIMGRNLERPFKEPKVFKPPGVEESPTETAVTEDTTTDGVGEDDAKDEDDDDESESEDDSSDDEAEDDNADEDASEDEKNSD